jgi:hypothetical protein
LRIVRIGYVQDGAHLPVLREVDVSLRFRVWERVSLETAATVAAGVTLGSEPVGDGTIELPYLRVANVLTAGSTPQK